MFLIHYLQTENELKCQEKLLSLLEAVLKRSALWNDAGPFTSPDFTSYVPGGGAQPKDTNKNQRSIIKDYEYESLTIKEAADI